MKESFGGETGGGDGGMGGKGEIDMMQAQRKGETSSDSGTEREKARKRASNGRQARELREKVRIGKDSKLAENVITKMGIVISRGEWGTAKLPGLPPGRLRLSSPPTAQSHVPAPTTSGTKSMSTQYFNQSRPFLSRLVY